jgi:hypothetical protein
VHSPPVPSSAGSVTHQGFDFGSFNTPVHANSVGQSRTDDRNDLNNLGGRERGSGPIGNFGSGLQYGHSNQYRSATHLAAKAEALPSQHPEPPQGQRADVALYYIQVTFHARNIYQAIANGYIKPDLQHAGPQQANQQHLLNRHSMLSRQRQVLPPTVNGFGELVLHEQSRGAAVGSNILVDPHTVVDPNATLDPNPNGGFIPLFLDEKAFNERKAAREADREISDYPRDNLPAQHRILARIYEAIRNTTGVEDSEKVAAKFADNSIPDAAIHEMCWDVMVSHTPQTC